MIEKFDIIHTKEDLKNPLISRDVKIMVKINEIINEVNSIREEMENKK